MGGLVVRTMRSRDHQQRTKDTYKNENNTYVV